MNADPRDRIRRSRPPRPAESPRDRLWRRLGGIAFGGDYNPEQWPAETRAEDMRLMTEAGVNLVTVGVFAWARVEPARGAYDFSFFDQVMDDLHAHRITADLATMTASPPPWLVHEHPEILPVTAEGTVLGPGARQHFCPSGPVYRERAAMLVERLAEHYRDHPALGMWHVGNEYGCHVAACYCEVSAADFRRWLRARYDDDIELLNDAWSTDFWSQRYATFDHVLPPRAAPAFPNPAQRLDHLRFSDDALRECFTVEADILRRITPGVPVTTNFLSGLKSVDVFGWAPEMDVVAVDSYPDPQQARPHLWPGLTYDTMRGAGGGAPWILMEQAPSAVNWRAKNAVKRPGQMRLWSWQAVAHGADAVMFFQWRQSRGGAEKYHSGMVPHAGPDSRVFREIVELGRELAAVPDLAGTRVRNQVAMLLDWHSWWALELDSHPSDGVRQLDRMIDHYAPLADLGAGVDVLPPWADLSEYALVVVPSLYLLSAADARRLDGYVAGGGALVVSFFSGIVDEYDRVHLGGYPAPLRDVLGVRVEEFWPAAERETFPVRGCGPFAAARGVADLWREDLRLCGAEAEFVFDAPGEPAWPAATRHAHGRGVARYLSTRLDEATMRAVLGRALREAGVAPAVAGLPPGVQASVRTGDGLAFLILLNHSADRHEVTLPGMWYDALGPSGEPVGTLHLPPSGVAVLRDRPRGADPAERSRFRTRRIISPVCPNA
ncbi:beta-galactosidase [Sphaerisporangium rufum]|uniref:Beta-galactosidase n=1 Tax=Sphaerisporangium rufum TaxID=1381558 RepID=A0A919QYZ8_9ACTN|nr:beta-galactosidase [Sphaerisporangium rufum]GII76577.1 beta-galactosidase [Sphaerisporangium rufum]